MMDPDLQNSADRFIRNTASIKQAFIWKNALLRRLAALLITADRRDADIESLRACNALIKDSTGVFSTFRGNASLTLATMLSQSDDPELLMANTSLVYNLMKQARFGSSDFLVLAACLTASQSEPDQYAQVISRARFFFDGMKKQHWFLTGQDDKVFCSLLGLSELDVESGLAQIEQLYQSLKLSFRNPNSIQALAQVLAIGQGSLEDRVARVRALSEAFRATGLKMDREYTLASLGVLSLLPQTDEELVRHVQETADYLKSQPGFGSWSVTKQELLLLSVSLVAFESVDEYQKNLPATALTTGIASIVIAQQTAVMIAVASSSSAASAAASSSH